MSAKQNDVTTSIYNRFETLIQQREDWQNNAYARSNQQLYGIIAECVTIYGLLTTGEGVKARKQGFSEFLNVKGYLFRDSTDLETKIIRCVFGDKDRRRLQTYTAVLRVAVSEKWIAADVPSRIAEFGGVQEVSLRKADGMTNSEKVEKAKAAFLGQSIATVESKELDSFIGCTKTGEPLVAVVTREEDGSFSVNFVVNNSSALNAALVAQFNAKKGELMKKEVEQSAADQSKSTTVAINSAAEAVRMLTASSANQSQEAIAA